MCGAAAPRLSRIRGQSLVACHKISGARANVKAVGCGPAVARLGSRDGRGMAMLRGGTDSPERHGHATLALST